MTLSLTINETLKWLSSLPILISAGHSGGDSVAIGIYSPSSPSSPPSPLPPLSPSLISLMVSVDVKHHVYLLTYLLNSVTDLAAVTSLGAVVFFFSFSPPLSEPSLPDDSSIFRHRGTTSYSFWLSDIFTIVTSLVREEIKCR